MGQMSSPHGWTGDSKDPWRDYILNGYASPEPRSDLFDTTPEYPDTVETIPSDEKLSTPRVKKRKVTTHPEDLTPVHWVLQKVIFWHYRTDHSKTNNSSSINNLGFRLILSTREYEMQSEN